MHQNKFHTETIQRLTAKAEASIKGGPPLNEEEQKVADYLKSLYKFANKGIKGRGKKETGPLTRGNTAQQRQADRIHEPATLLPPPNGVAGRTLEGTSYLHSGASGWPRSERMEDVFVGGQHAQAQSNNFSSGISGDAGGVGLGGYAFGSVG